MKKFFVIVFLFAVVLSVNVFAADIFINDRDSFCDGIILNGRVMVPVRGVFEKLGYSVSWNTDTKTATLVNNENQITIRSGSAYIYVNTRAIRPDVPQIIIDGMMYIPLRAISEAVSADVAWNENSKTVNIITSSRVITLSDISRSNTLENILNIYPSVTVKNEYTSVKSDQISQSFEISFGKDENGNYIYTYSDPSGLKRLMCYEGEFSISPDGRTTSYFFADDMERNNAIMNCYNYVDSNIMIAASENGTILSLNTYKTRYKADVTITMDVSSPSYGVWAEVWGITDKRFDICHEYTLDKETLAVKKSNIFCSLKSGRFDVGNTTQTYDKKMSVPEEFRELVSRNDKNSGNL